MGKTATNWNWGDLLLNAHPVDIKNKEETVRNFAAYMLARTARLEEIHGLPETMPEREIIKLLQTQGYFVTPAPDAFPDKLEPGELYGMTGGLGAKLDAYYFPTICTIANPHIGQRGFSAEVVFEDDKEGVLVKHDSYLRGLLPIFNRYATLMAEVDISMVSAIILSRVEVAMAAPDDRTKKSAELFIEKLIKGDISVIDSNDFMDGVRGVPLMAGGNTITQLIEAKQYLKAGCFNEIGLNANYNMKRESINSVEAQIDDDALLPLVDDIIYTQQRDFERFNRRFGTNIEVDRASAWRNREAMAAAEVEQAENEAEDAETPDDNQEPESEVNPNET